MTKRKVFGFTLIELLVVIAIIAMLAAILVPAVNRALLSAAMVQTVSNGANIYKSAFAGQMDDVVLGGGYSAWPNTTDAIYGTSSSYFVHLVTSGVMTVSFDFFSARGLQAIKSSVPADFLAAAQTANAWNLVRGLDSAREGTPFLFTRNAPADVPMNDSAIVLNATQDPFRGEGMVVVLKGGSAFSLRSQQVRGSYMNPAQDAAAIIDVVGP
jgi:prepilin-type N-terminal cleavage/methylation domain-containing protein